MNDQNAGFLEHQIRKVIVLVNVYFTCVNHASELVLITYFYLIQCLSNVKCMVCSGI